MPHLKNSNATFWMIFQHCVCKRSIFTFSFLEWKCELSFQFLTFLTDWNVKALSSQELKTRKIGKVWSSNPHLILIISINVVWLRNSTFLHRHHGMKMALFHLKLSPLNISMQTQSLNKIHVHDVGMAAGYVNTLSRNSLLAKNSIITFEIHPHTLRSGNRK